MAASATFRSPSGRNKAKNLDHTFSFIFKAKIKQIYYYYIQHFDNNCRKYYSLKI
jgi:hypothetical protein